jgi:hypothetical protein
LTFEREKNINKVRCSLSCENRHNSRPGDGVTGFERSKSPRGERRTVMELKMDEKTASKVRECAEKVEGFIPLKMMAIIGSLIDKAYYSWEILALITLAPADNKEVLKTIRDNFRQSAFPDSENKKVFYLMAARALAMKAMGGVGHGQYSVKLWLKEITKPCEESIGLGVATCLWAIREKLISSKEAEDIIIEAAQQPGFRFGTAEEIATPIVDDLLKESSIGIRRVIQGIPQNIQDIDQSVGTKKLLETLCFALFKSLSPEEKAKLFS